MVITFKLYPSNLTHCVEYEPKSLSFSSNIFAFNYQVITQDAQWVIIFPMTIITFLALWFMPTPPNTKYPLEKFDVQYLIQAAVLCMDSITVSAYTANTNEDRFQVCALMYMVYLR